MLSFVLQGTLNMARSVADSFAKRACVISIWVLETQEGMAGIMRGNWISHVCCWIQDRGWNESTMMEGHMMDSLVDRKRVCTLGA